MENSPIYIGGPDRCGKTTMRAFLASHPRIAIPSVGSNMWTYFYGQYDDLAKKANFERCLEAMLDYKHVALLEPDPARIRQEFWQGPPTYARLFDLFLVHYAEREGKPRRGAQTGLIERYTEHLIAAYPGVKIIHMLRDPRDRYEASLALWPNGKGLVGGATARWLYSLNLAKRYQRRYPDQYMIVRYEDMVTWPEQTIRKVCDFLNEEFVPTMLTMDGALKHREQLTKGAKLEPGAIPVSPDYIGGYKGKVSPREIAFMQIFAGRSMQEHGYKLEPHPQSLADILHFSVVEWPLNLVRMAAWWTVEGLQQTFPGYVRRKPGRRMILTKRSQAKRTPVSA